MLMAVATKVPAVTRKIAVMASTFRGGVMAMVNSAW